MGIRVLVLDTPDNQLDSLRQALASAAGQQCEVSELSSLRQLLARLKQNNYDLVVLDYQLGDGRTGGREVLRKVRKAQGQLPIIAVAQSGTVETARAAIADGATDFMVRGGQLEERVATLLGKVRALLELMEHNRRLSHQNRLLRQAHQDRWQIVGQSPQIKAVLARISRVAGIPRPVLIIGQRGTGKELVARAIHEASGRAEHPFVVVNCAAVADTLLESELFGHERGAFTGAEARTPGRFEQADGGTIFLDEIGNMSLPFQQKILRVVEYGTFTRVGGAEELHVDVRLLAATNADLRDLIRQGKFLQDLYDRLSFEIVEVPPLCQRQGDVEVLAWHFLNQFMQEIPAMGGKSLSRSAIDALSSYNFPGNVRELKNIIERAAYRDTSNEITPEDIGMLNRPDDPPAGGNFQEQVEAFERRLILDALAKAQGNQAQAARTLGLSYHQFRYYHQKYTA